MQRVTPVTVLYNAVKLIPELSRTLSGLPVSPPVLYDCGSSDGSAASAASLIQGAAVIQGPNGGFGYGNNRCIEKVDTEYTLLLNADASIGPEDLAQLVSFLDRNPVHAAVQPLVRIWGHPPVTASRGVFLTRYGEAWDSGFMHLEPAVPTAPLDVPSVTAAVSLWRTSVLRGLGGFDEGFFMYFEDADLSLRTAAEGHRLAVVRSARAFHVAGASSSRSKASLWELASSIRMFKRYLGNGRLTGEWWKREFRIQLFMLSRGISPAGRLRMVAGAMSNGPDVVELPDSLRGELFGSPLDLPLPRFERTDADRPWYSRSLETDSIEAFLSSTVHAVTGVFLDEKGMPVKRFIVPPGKTSFYRLAVKPGLLYIKCDSPDDRLKVVINETS